MQKDNQDELFYWVDETDSVLGSITRREAHSGSGLIHRSVSLLVFNQANELLLQQRSKYKDTGALQWAESVGGHVTFGETYEEAIVRETKEELGFTPQNVDHKHTSLVSFSKQREINACYTTHIHFTPKQFNKNEILQVRWLKLSNLRDFPTLIRLQNLSESY